jgi:UDP-N-acetylglucosamine/UDP-N-acetylgalactosamine diphosphorylase
VFEFVDKGLIPAGDGLVEAFVAQLEAIDVELVNELFSATTKAYESGAASDMSKLEPASDSDVVSAAKMGDAECERLTKVALAAMAAGEVAVVVLAGGQGTRLGSSLPKAAYDAGLPSGKVLAAFQADRIQRLRSLAAVEAGVAVTEVHIPWYVMTSPQTHAATIECFEEHAHFGLPVEDVRLFQQGQLPCLSGEGRILLESALCVAMAPDGNGGIYRGLHLSGCVEDMAARGVKLLHAYAVDNLVSKVADPLFVGLCLDRGADVGSKVVPKANAHEKVGVLCRKGGRYAVVEYSDMPDAAKEEAAVDGTLRYNAGNICVHAYSLGFLQGAASPDKLSRVYHVANKKIATADPATGRKSDPKELKANNGIKLESFIFDVFEAASAMAVLEVERAGEFSPVKNAPGTATDSPDSARTISSTQCRSWLEAAGVTIEGEGVVELSPLVSYGGEGLDALAGATLTAPCYVCLLPEVAPATAVPDARLTTASGLTLVSLPEQSRPVSEQLKMGESTTFNLYAIDAPWA